MRITLPLISLFLLCAWSPRSSAEPTGRRVYRVDMERAMHSTPEGRRAREALEQRLKRKQTELDSKARALKKQREQAMKANDAEKLAEVEKGEQELVSDLVEAQKQIVVSEEGTVALLVARLEDLVIKANQDLGEDGVIFDNRHVQFLGLPASCDLTDWLVTSSQTKGVQPVPVRDECRYSGFAYIEMQRIMDESKEGKAALANLQRQHLEMQSELNRRTEKIKRLKEAGDELAFQNEMLKLDSLYRAFQKDLETQQATELKRLVQALELKLKAAVRPVGRLLFLARRTKKTPLLTPRCEPTDWAIRYFDGTAEARELDTICPP